MHPYPRMHPYAGKAVEVTYAWKHEAHSSLRRTLASFSLRLELHVRALIQQRAGSTSMVARAEAVLEVPSIRARL